MLENLGKEENSGVRKVEKLHIGKKYIYIDYSGFYVKNLISMDGQIQSSNDIEWLN